MQDPCDAVRSSARAVVEQAEFCTISDDGIHLLAQSMDAASIAAGCFDHNLHFYDPQRPDLVAQYLLAVDALNFCFWPEEGLEYEQLAGGLKRAVLADPAALDAHRLAGIDGPGVRALLGWPRPLPLEGERARLLREVGAALLELYGGLAANLVRAAGQSAPRLVRLVTAAFPGFRDHCVYRGRQLFFYKRAQIFVGDVWGCFRGAGLGAFTDIDRLTMFADYRVPVVLRELGVLRYAPSLAQAVDGRQELPAGGQEEVEIRAATVEAVERLKNALQGRLDASEAQRGQQGMATGADEQKPSLGGGSSSADGGAPAGAGGAGGRLNSVLLDWALWEEGERQRHSHRPHHRVLTVFY